MVKTKSSVLVAGIRPGPFKTLAPVLRRHKLEVVRVASPEKSVDLARSKRFDLVIFDAEPRKASLEDVVALIRDRRSESRSSSILVLAEYRSVDAARTLVGHGVNRVMLLDDPPALIDQQMAQLLHIAPRAGVRLPTRLRTSVADRREEVLCEIVNISISGLLVETDAQFEVGEQVVVSIYTEDRDHPIVAKAEVVRRTMTGRDKINGFGIRFLSFAADGKLRIRIVVENVFANSPHMKFA
jgi:ActR/RegA family two-component response regulator/Tfp pilus assembly protein PilZ